ncbi:zinc finger CCCH domain-containing protein 53-like isoform X2 [Typha angustifolia]|uniref:zinc finger CCCH domain-containing protein 53-like isoform X2 n=1 Tax=Typha angustifolia TaxID=59011 RepID=UPI003C3025AB
MDAYEATKVVFSRIQSLDPDNAAKIMGFLLVQEHSEKEMIRLAFGPESLLHSVILKARKDLSLLSPPPPPSSSHFLLSRQNSSSQLLGSLPSPTSWAPPQPFSRTVTSTNVANGGLDEIHSSNELISPRNQVGSPFYEEFQLQSPIFYSDWGANLGSQHRRSCSITDLCLGSDAGLGWKPCLYFARGYCKNGTSCRFLHGLPEEKMELMASALPYSPLSPSSTPNKGVNFLLQQQQNESQRTAAAAAAAMMLGGDEGHKFMARSPRIERSDLAAGLANPGSRQIYLTFPADSTFREEDVSNYFSIYGPVQDVRIPYQQKRMFGFVTFVYPETVKVILAKGNPHFVCDARVLVKPYKEKGKVPDKKQQQQPERGDFSGCSTPTGLLDARDPFELPQLGTRLLYSTSSNQEALLRKKLEEQQQAAELQQAIELQRRRFMGLQLLDLKTRNHLNSTTIAIPTATTATTAPAVNDDKITGSNNIEDTMNQDKKLSSCAAAVTTGPSAAAAAVAASTADSQEPDSSQAVNSALKEESSGEATTNVDCDTQESGLEHNLPDSPFASPTKASLIGDSFSTALPTEAPQSNNISHLMASTLIPPTSTLDLASYNSCFFQMPRFSSGHGAIGM